MSYSELGARYPRAGGEYVFLSELFSPLAGFLSGWVSFIVGFSAPIAASSLAFSEYLIRTIPDGAGPEQILLFKKAAATGIILIFTLIHYFGLKSGSKVQNMLTMLKITLIFGLLIAGFSFGEGSFSISVLNCHPGSETAGLKTIGLSLMWIMFAYSGWNAATYVGSEVLNPVRNIPRSLITGTLLVTLFYLLLEYPVCLCGPGGGIEECDFNWRPGCQQAVQPDHGSLFLAFYRSDPALIHQLLDHHRSQGILRHGSGRTFFQNSKKG